MKLGMSLLSFIQVMTLTSCMQTATVTPQIKAEPSPPNWNIPSETYDRVAIEDDDFQQSTTFQAPDLAPEPPLEYFLRASKDYGSSTFDFQIYFTERYHGNWRFYNEAFDSNGNRIKVLIISRDAVYANTLEEHIRLDVDRTYLESSIEDGIRIKLYGDACEKMIFIPGGYIKGFLSRADSVTK